LDDGEKQWLTALRRKHGAGQAIAERARIVLAAADGLRNKEIAEKLGVCAHTVGRWRNRFAEQRLDGLHDEPRPGAPRQIGDDEIAATIQKTLEMRPKGATHRSLRTMAKEIGHAPSTVHRIWRAFGLQPHRAETFKLSSDPLFVEKVRDIAGLYLSPPERALVLCVDEKSQVQALDRTQPLSPLNATVAPRSAWADRAAHPRLQAAWNHVALLRGKITSRRPRRHGSTRSSVSPRCSPIAPSNAAFSVRSANSNRRSTFTSRPHRPIRSHAAGPKPPTTSWPVSNASVFGHSMQMDEMKRTSESGR
jgi:transposase